ncbi:hypothetical protein AK812_SmicGene31871 [Symbiodinium microadriaticum]|uniref:Uncharacterized protein n=1 Tax=Symbiodinium microadriaticum TaxID=2951 RepID=A0A1Q9CVM9_SYMMI|nr:hypothetical protein AK812_SmicGene31871 [Symbiodinium microadriaticum]
MIDLGSNITDRRVLYVAAMGGCTSFAQKMLRRVRQLLRRLWAKISQVLSQLAWMQLMSDGEAPCLRSDKIQTLILENYILEPEYLSPEKVNLLK